MKNPTPKVKLNPAPAKVKLGAKPGDAISKMNALKVNSEGLRMGTRQPVGNIRQYGDKGYTPSTGTGVGYKKKSIKEEKLSPKALAKHEASESKSKEKKEHMKKVSAKSQVVGAYKKRGKK